MTSSTDKDERTKVEPQVRYDRSRSSAFDLLKLLVSLATGGVGVFFAVLTQKLDPALREPERDVAVVGLVTMVLAVLAGLLGWGADARYYERWAQSLQHEASAGRLWRARRTANVARRVLLASAAVLFWSGRF